MPKLVRSLLSLTLISLLVGCDHVTKYVAKSELEDGDAVTLVPGWFRLVYAENHDVGFNLLSFLPDPPKWVILLVVQGLVSLIIAVVLIRLGAHSRFHGVALGLVLAGALGNLIDRGVRGYVVDFLHLQHWPVFNLADVYVTLGALALILEQASAVRRQPSGRA